MDRDDLFVGANLEVALLDLALQLFELAAPVVLFPGRDARVEDVVHLLEGETLCLGRHERHVDEGGGVEGAKDVVHLEVDVPQQGGHGKGQDAVPEPVGRRRQADGLGADLAGEDLGRVRPADGAPGGGEGSDEEVRTGDDGRRHGPVLVHDPADVAVVVVERRRARVGLPVVLLQRADDEEPRHHQERADDQGRAPAELVEVDDGRECHDDVDDILDRGREELF